MKHEHKQYNTIQQQYIVTYSIYFPLSLLLVLSSSFVQFMMMTQEIKSQTARETIFYNETSKQHTNKLDEYE